MRTNPFPRTAARPAQYLFGRRSVLKHLERAAHEVQTRQCSNLITILAPAGLGKTCILKHMRSQLQQQGWLCGYSEASPDASTAIADFLTDARQALPSGGAGAKLLARLQEFNVSAGPIGLGFKLGDSDNGTPYSRVLQCLTSLGDLAKRANVGVALLIDEAQALPTAELALLYRVINGLDLPVMKISAGLPGIPDQLYVQPTTVTPSFYLQLDSLKPEDTFSAITTPLIDNGEGIEKKAVNFLVDFAAGHPQTIQMVASAAWIEADERTGDDDTLIISASDARAAIDTTLRQLSISAFNPIWNNCTEPEKLALRYTIDVATYPHHIPYKPRPVLSGLVAKGIIYNNPIEFVYPGFRDFVSERMPQPIDPLLPEPF